MSLSKEVLDSIAFAEQMGFSKLNLLPPAQTREAMKHAPAAAIPSPVAKVINTNITENIIPVRIYIPEGAGPFPVISYFHGGGFVLMSIDTHDEICRQLCAGSNAIVMSVEYSLAPEHSYPAGPNDCIAATKWMMENATMYNGDGQRMAVAGDSAGGYMALYTAQKLKAAGISLKAQVAAYPVTDHYTSKHASWKENKEGYVLTATIMKWFWDNYITDASKFDEASPLRTADFSGLPPALIMTANYDPLRDEGRAYADKLHAANVPAIYKNYENIHGFFGLGEMGQQAMQQACIFLKENLKLNNA
jgi:acetyl esterase